MIRSSSVTTTARKSFASVSTSTTARRKPRRFYSDLAKSGDKTAPQYRAISGLGAIDAITARVFEALK